VSFHFDQFKTSLIHHDEFSVAMLRRLSGHFHSWLHRSIDPFVHEFHDFVDTPRDYNLIVKTHYSATPTLQFFRPRRPTLRRVPRQSKYA